jgi:hypothetical protein
MELDKLTYGEMKQIAAMFSTVAIPAAPAAHDAIPVVVCTDKRGVVFGYCSDTAARPIKLTAARMCLYWSSDVGGVFGLGEKGPTTDCKISAALSELTLEGVTAIFTVDPAAEKAWIAAKVQGR